MPDREEELAMRGFAFARRLSALTAEDLQAIRAAGQKISMQEVVEAVARRQAALIAARAARNA